MRQTADHRAHRRNAVALLAGCWLIWGIAAPPVQASQQAENPLPADLTQLSLDELLNIEVTSVSKHAEPLEDSAAAVFVLTGDEIRSSGARSIAEALRLVPGLDVARSSAQTYAISARGFNATSADKLQVLLDGRSVYTPLFSGVFWDALDTYLGDIDRIEVIRGPGAALWGANAVNGVINIITKSARDTQGMSARASGGTVERGFAGARAGLATDSGAMRIYAQGVSRGSSNLPNGDEAPDGMRLEQTGFRSDWALPGSQSLTVSGDGYTGRESSPGIQGAGVAKTTVSGQNLLARWSGSTWSLQAYYDGYDRDEQYVYAERRHTGDIDFQQSITLGATHTLLYGAGYRISHDKTADPPQAALIFSPGSQTLHNGSAFIQDQFALGPRLQLTLGSKFEYGTYVKFEAEPSVRVGWRATDALFNWAAISRAVRTPNRFDRDVAIYCPPPSGYPGACGPGVFRIGNPDLGPTKLIAYEWGLRYLLHPNLSVDLATFYNDYTDLRTTETTPVPFGGYANKLDAHSYGGELALLWRPLEWATVRPSYQYLQIDARPQDGSTDVSTGPSIEGSSPRHQASLRMTVNPAANWHAEADLRYVDRIRAIKVPSYTEMNLRVAYLIVPHLEVALSGQNLLDAQHQEWSENGTQFELRRGGMLEFSWGLP